MSRYVLTSSAQEDLVQIRQYYLHEAGTRIARQMMVEFVEAFRFLARTPSAGHSREDLAESRPVLFWPLREYLIVYRKSTSPLQIVMIARGSRDIPRIIEQREL